MSGPSVGALFAGYGGLELAAQDVWPGAHLSWVSEFDAGPSRILAHHWPDVPNHGDVTRIDWSAVEPVDIITGGSPCQDLSHAGKRLGMKAGTRSGLWASMCDAIETIRPSLVIWENVRGALSAPATAGRVESCGLCVDRNGGPSLRALGRVLGDLAELGYDAAWTGLRAADVGAPHGRWRVFVLAWPQGDAAALTWPQGDAAALLPTPAVNDMGASYTPDEWDEWTARMQAKHGNGNGHGASLSIEALRLLPSPRTSDTNGAGVHGDGGLDLRTAVSLLPTPRATDGTKGGPNQRGSSGDLMLPSAVSRLERNAPCSDGSEADCDASTEPTCGCAGAPAAATAGAGSTNPMPAPSVVALLPTPKATNNENRQSEGYGGERGNFYGLLHNRERWGIYAPAIRRWEPLTRPAPDPTEPTGRDGAHRLSPRFVEWMQGLPEGHVTDPAVWHGMKPSAARNAMLKALGNGVVPQQGAAAIRRLLGIRAAYMAEAAAS